MDFELSHEHQLLRRTVREFAEAEIRPLAQELDAKEEFSVDLTRRMGKLGLLGITVPVEYGGQGLDYLSYVIAVEELSRVDGSQAATVTAHNSLGAGPLVYYGSEEQKLRYLPRLATGEALWGFGLTEPNAGSDSRGTRTTARIRNDQWVIDGSKIFITNGSTPITDGVTVQAVTARRDDRPEFTCFLVDRGTPGFTATTMHDKLMWRASNTAELSFQDCVVGDGQRLGNIGDGSRQMLETLNTGRLGIAAMALGAAQGAYELALDYARGRNQFGSPISRFQGIAFKLADMATEIDHARTYLYRACWLRDTARPFRKEAAMAKLYCTEMAGRVTDEAVQIHGGYGLMESYDVERFWRDHRILRIGEGTSEIQRLIIAREIGC